MLPVQTIAGNPGYPLTLANHVFDGNDAGELTHTVDGQLRATVPPEGWDDYVKYWPAAIDVVRQLRGAHDQKQTDARNAMQAKVAAALATLPAGSDPKMTAAVTAAVSAAVGIDAPAAAAPANPLADPEVQKAIATLKAKGIGVAGG